jgi:hypothetical protein
MSGVNFKVTDENGNEKVCVSCDEVIGWCLGRKGLTIEVIGAPDADADALKDAAE